MRGLRVTATAPSAFRESGSAAVATDAAEATMAPVATSMVCCASASAAASSAYV